MIGKEGVVKNPICILLFILYLDLLRDGFGEETYFKVILVELVSPDLAQNPPTPSSPAESLPPSASMEKNENLVGYALYFFNYSTWQGRVLYLEDLYIRANYRSKHN